MSMSMSIVIYIEMPECPGLSGIWSAWYRTEKTNNAETVPVWTKLTQSGIFLVQYLAKIRDAGMPMPVLVSSMPMPSYGNFPYS